MRALVNGGSDSCPKTRYVLELGSTQLSSQCHRQLFTVLCDDTAQGPLPAASIYEAYDLRFPSLQNHKSGRPLLCLSYPICGIP